MGPKMGPSASRIRMNMFPLGKATWATRRVSSGMAESGDKRKGIAYLLDRSNRLAQTARTASQSPTLRLAYDVVSQDSSHRGLVGARQQSTYLG